MQIPAFLHREWASGDLSCNFDKVQSDFCDINPFTPLKNMMFDIMHPQVKQ